MTEEANPPKKKHIQKKWKWGTARSDRPLNKRQLDFVMAYCASGKVKDSYIAAGYSPKCAGPRASAMLSDPRIKEAIMYHQNEVRERTIDATARALSKASLIAYGDIGDIMQWDDAGIRYTDSQQLTPEQRALIAQVKPDQNGRPVIQMQDQMAALEKILRAHNAYAPVSKDTAGVTVTMILGPGVEVRSTKVIPGDVIEKEE